MRSEKGLELHKQAEHTREAGQFEESVKLAEEAIKAYEADGDFLGQSDACGSLSLSLRHLKRLDEAENAALAGIKIAEEHDLGGDRSRPYFNLAKVQEQKKDYKTAVDTYKKSIEIFEKENPTLHNRSGVLADMKIHLTTCEYMAGDKSALDRALGAIEELKNSNEREVLQYNYDVWLSGGHMRIAEMLKSDNLELAKEHLANAKEIIDANPQLEIRLKQWQELSQNFS